MFFCQLNCDPELNTWRHSNGAGFKFVVDDMKHKKSLTCLVVKGEGRHYSRCDIFENESIIKAVLNKGLTFSHTHCTTESQTKCKWHPKFRCKWHFKLKWIFIHSSFYESSVMTVFAENWRLHFSFDKSFFVFLHAIAKRPSSITIFFGILFVLWFLFAFLAISLAYIIHP